MMWPFRKKGTLVATTNTPHLVEMFPVKSAETCLPQWYKNMPLTFSKGACPVQHSLTNQNSTIKTCTGVNALLRKGFILSAWEDISIVVYPNGTVSAVGANPDFVVTVHDKRELPPSMQHLTVVKLLSPWYLDGDDTEYLVTPTVYHSSLGRNLFVPSGVVNYKTQHGTHVFLGVTPKQEPYEVFIKGGEPLIHLIPLTDKKVSLEVKYDPTYVPFAPRSFFLLHGYNRYMNWIKRNGDAS